MENVGYTLDEEAGMADKRQPDEDVIRGKSVREENGSIGKMGDSPEKRPLDEDVIGDEKHIFVEQNGCIGRVGDSLEKRPLDEDVITGETGNLEKRNSTVKKLGNSLVKRPAAGSEASLVYKLTDIPPVHLCFIFGLQQVLLSISSTISIPLVVSRYICADHLELVTAEIMATFLFMSGVCTLLQDLLGVRLPIIQGGCHKFLPAIAALMTLDTWKCPPKELMKSVWNGTEAEAMDLNVTLYDDTEVWQSRMREIQGGIMLASLVQVAIGCTGILGFLLNYLGPLTIIPCITLVGLSLVNVALNFCASHLGIAALTVFLIFVFSLYLGNFKPPLPAWSRKEGCHFINYPIFKLFSVILTVIITWGLCAILTSYDVFSPTGPQKMARTDAKEHVLQQSRWLFFPYPAQWGIPTVSSASFVAMLAATITSIIESVGDYYACARISSVPPPPAHAVNRGIFMEGVGSLLSGAVGSGGATTSYSQNVGAIGFTRVASRAVFVTAGLIFLVSGILGKLGAFLTMIPDPVLGGVLLVGFGMVTSVGLSNMQFVNMTSSRNLTIIGSAMLIGLMVPEYLKKYPDVINTGNSGFDQAMKVLLSTSMFVGGALGFILDNTVPGSDEERGILKWRAQVEVGARVDPGSPKDSGIYDLPLIMPCLRKLACTRYIPCLPGFNVRPPKMPSCRQKQKLDINP